MHNVIEVTSNILTVRDRTYTVFLCCSQAVTQLDTLCTDPTNTFQKSIRKCLNSCKTQINNKQKAKLINVNPYPANIHGLTRIHKLENPIRQLVNWWLAPGYKLTKFFTNLLNQIINLPDAFNIKNATDLINDLKEINIHSNIRWASSGILNMYTNIRMLQLIHIVGIILNQNLTELKQKT